MRLAGASTSVQLQETVIPAFVPCWLTLPMLSVNSTEGFIENNQNLVRCELVDECGRLRPEPNWDQVGRSYVRHAKGNVRLSAGLALEKLRRAAMPTCQGTASPSRFA